MDTKPGCGGKTAPCCGADSSRIRYPAPTEKFSITKRSWKISRRAKKPSRRGSTRKRKPWGSAKACARFSKPHPRPSSESTGTARSVTFGTRRRSCCWESPAKRRSAETFSTWFLNLKNIRRNSFPRRASFPQSGIWRLPALLPAGAPCTSMFPSRPSVPPWRNTPEESSSSPMSRRSKRRRMPCG